MEKGIVDALTKDDGATAYPDVITNRDGTSILRTIQAIPDFRVYRVARRIELDIGAEHHLQCAQSAMPSCLLCNSYWSAVLGKCAGKCTVKGVARSCQY